MQLPTLTLPRAVPPQTVRKPQETVPQTKPERDRIKRAIAGYVAEHCPVPPLAFDELRRHADAVVTLCRTDPKYRDYIAVLLNNEVWRDALAAVPYDRRLLLLPKCLRVEDRCPAPFDEFGLLCKQCGLCTIQDLQNEAERLGYAVLVAEGSAIVMALIETGKIDAIVGVSCLSVLEKAFPYMESAAVPGVAIPLLQDDCHDTNVDIDWLWDVIHLTRDDKTQRLDLDALRREVETWFEPTMLDEIMSTPSPLLAQSSPSPLVGSSSPSPLVEEGPGGGPAPSPLLAPSSPSPLVGEGRGGGAIGRTAGMSIGVPPSGTGVPPVSDTQRIARDWLAKSGKRWRPFLVVCAWKALQEDPDAPLPPDLRKVAVAVECFHKASLVHDDIEDGDATRYGEPALHAEYGMPVALNVGDFLLGEGYRLIAECAAPPEARAQMLRVAAAGHRTLCLGQGAELCWTRAPRPLSVLEVLDIFRKKTSPAFEVALRLGAVYAGADDGVHDVLANYSEALGIAYQVRDDLEDLSEGHAPDDLAAMRPSLGLAIAHERTKGKSRTLLNDVWQRRAAWSQVADDVPLLFKEAAVQERLHGLLEGYKEEAVRSLIPLENASLKGLLRRVIGKIFSVEVKGWCSEFEARNAASREARPQTVG